MAQQLRRAALSIPLSIAEGYGKRGPNDRSRRCAIARGSAPECGAILDAARVLALVEERTFAEGQTLLYLIVSMQVEMVTCIDGASAKATATARATRMAGRALAAASSTARR